MTEKYDFALLAELGRIVAKYGPEAVARLAEQIRDPVRAEELAVALEFAAVRSPQKKVAPKAKFPKSERVGIQVLNELRSADPEKHSLIAEVRRELLSGTILQSMADIRRFALMNDLSIGKASSRNAAIAPLLRSLSELSTPEINSLRDALIQYNTNDRSLERWRDVIVRPRTSRKSETDDSE